MGFFDDLNPIKWIGSAFDLGDTIGSRLGLWKSSSEQSMDQQMDFQREMAELQQKHWFEQFNAVNAYNTPARAVQRYLAAGVAPSAGFTSSTVGQSSASPQVGAGGSPVPYSPETQNFAQKFSTIAQGLASLGSAFKSTKEGQRTAALMGKELEGLSIDNSMKQFQYEVAQKHLDKYQEVQIKQMLAQANRDYALADVASEEQLLKMEQRFNVIAERAGKIAQSEMLSQEALHWLETYRVRLQEARSRIQSNKASASASYASAKFSESQAKREEFFNKLRADPGVRHSLQTALMQEGKKAKSQNKLTEQQAKQFNEITKKLAFANDVQTFEYYWQKVKEFWEMYLKTGETSAKVIDSIVPF